MWWICDPKRGVRPEAFGDEWVAHVHDWNWSATGTGASGVLGLANCVRRERYDVCVLWLPTGLRARHVEPPVVTKTRPWGVHHLPDKTRTQLSRENSRIRNALTLASAVSSRGGHVVWVQKGDSRLWDLPQFQDTVSHGVAELTRQDLCVFRPGPKGSLDFFIAKCLLSRLEHLGNRRPGGHTHFNKKINFF